MSTSTSILKKILLLLNDAFFQKEFLVNPDWNYYHNKKCPLHITLLNLHTFLKAKTLSEA